jgi:hypothetical protein
MTANIARQGGRVQLEQSDICLAMDMAKMAKGGLSCTAIVEMQYLIKRPCAKVSEEQKQGVEFTEHNKGKAAIERHLAALYQNQMDGCLPYQNGTANDLQPRWRRNGSGASQTDRCRQRNTEPTPSLPRSSPLPRLPHVPPSKTARARPFQIRKLLVG